MKKLLPILGCAVLAVLPLACATLPIPTAESAYLASQQWPGATLADLQTGRRLYVQTCASCHGLHMPSEYPPERWDVILIQMQPKARIDDATRDLILHYLVTASIQSHSY